MDSKQEKVLNEAAKIIEDSGVFKKFHGNITFNMAFGKAKNFIVNQNILPEKQKSS